MKLDKAAITILIGSDTTRIQLHDQKANIQICEVTLTAEQLASALSRCAYTMCETVVSDGLDVLNKIMEHKPHEFEIPPNIDKYKNEGQKRLEKLAEESCPKGWVSDNYFGSQSSFFSKDGKNYARVTIRRWV